MMTPLGTIERVLENWLGTNERECAEQVLDALTEYGWVVVRCGPGDHISVQRETVRCERCKGSGETSVTRCPVCGGSGVVDTVQVQALEPADPFEVFTASDGMPAIRGRSDLFRLVALPEETPVLNGWDGLPQAMRRTGEVALPEETP